MKRNYTAVFSLNIGMRFLSHHATCILDHLHQCCSIISINVSNLSKLVPISYPHNLLMLHHFEKHYIMIVDVHHKCLQTHSLDSTSIRVITGNKINVYVLNIIDECLILAFRNFLRLEKHYVNCFPGFRIPKGSSLHMCYYYY